MKLVFAWIMLFSLVLFSFYFINQNLEKTVGISELLNISITKDATIYSAKNIDNNDEFIEFSLKKESEIFLITGNSTKKNKKGDKEITIDINRENKDVILILNSNDKTKWNINPSENTNIKLVIYDTKSEINSTRLIYKYKREIDLDLDIENTKFLKLLKYINKITQKENINYFYSSEVLDNKIKITNIQINPKFSLNYLSPKKTKINFDFELISKDYKFIPFSLSGPVNFEDKFKEIKINLVSSPDKRKIYEIIKNGLKIIDTSTKKIIFKPIPILKKLLNPKGIAYDDLSDMVHLVNKYGKFYIFDAHMESWKSIRKYMDDFPINSISYDTYSNTFVSSNWRENGLIIFDQKGNFDNKYDLKNKLLGFDYHYKKSSEIPQLYLVPQGENIGIILIDKFVQKIWLYNKLDRKAILTYNYMY
jgi:hypothetical protein